MYNSSVALGQVWHKRYLPKIHEFNYKINMWLIDSDDEVYSINKNLSIFYKYRQNDYICGNKDVSLKDRVLFKLLENGIKLDIGFKVFLLGQVSNIGCYFSPLNLFLIYDTNETLLYILAEVSNTPWNERYYYVLNPNDKFISHNKAFHVSPFFPMNQQYIWDFRILKNSIYFKIDIIQANEKVFSATFNSKLIDLKTASSNKLFLKKPFNGLKIIISIYFQAIRLFIKKLKLYKHPKHSIS